MSSAAKDKISIYQALLSLPGMSDKCKAVFQLSRQNILLLSRIIETGLKSIHELDDGLASMISKETREELEQVVPELLKKAGLSEFYEKLKTF